jgi:hypothetical protein
MNLVAKWGDSSQNVEENTHRLAAMAGFDRERLFVAKQVHGASVYEVSNIDSRLEVAAREVDVLVAREKKIVVAVSTADCAPLLLEGPGVVAAAHAGWRGTIAGVGAAAVSAMKVDPALIRAAIGPCICVQCFEVGEEVAAHFAPAHVRREAGTKPHVDLQAANAAPLRDAGVQQVDIIPGCTFHEPERFFSYRRDQGKGGGHLSFIGLR